MIGWLLGVLVVIMGPRMVINLRAYELKTRQPTMGGEFSTLRFGTRSRVPMEESVDDDQVHVELAYLPTACPGAHSSGDHDHRLHTLSLEC